MKETEKRFEVLGAKDPNLGSAITVFAVLNKNGSCNIKTDTNALNHAQQTKLSLLIIKQIASLSYDRLDSIPMDENCPASIVRNTLQEIGKLASLSFKAIEGIPGQ